jgi:hypothetical protein
MAAEQYPAVLRGDTSGEQALFGPEGISAWVKYFSNANPLYAVSNRVGALAAEQGFDGKGAILELDGGLGSGAEALLERLQQTHRAVPRYRFTEISPLFMKRAERVLARWRTAGEFQFSHLDIDHRSRKPVSCQASMRSYTASMCCTSRAIWRRRWARSRRRLRPVVFWSYPSACGRLRVRRCRWSWYSTY